MVIDEQRMASLIADTLGERPTALARAPRGQISETWFFSACGKDYVIRLIRRKLGFLLRKDQFITERVLNRGASTDAIPVARFVATGESDETVFTITERVHGELVDEMDDAAVEALIPTMLDMLDRIHETSLDGLSGYGGFDHQGSAPHTSWPEYLLSVADADPNGFHGNWHHLFDDSILERDLFETLLAEMRRLLPHCPAERHLIHGDYGADNMIARDGEIVAVLDWANARLGDFLWDIAWLGICMPDHDVVGTALSRYASKGQRLASAEARLRCYYCYIGLDTLRFFARSNHEDGYRWIRSRIRAMTGI